MISMSAQETPLAFIGLGLMGSRMARRLVDAGYPLTVYNRSRDKTRPLADAGASVAESPREAAESADFVLVCVQDDGADDAVLFGESGAIAGTRAGKTLIDLSSVSPDIARRAAAAGAAKGIRVLDCPVSGSTPQAEAGTLLIVGGGDPTVLEEARPVLEHLGRPVHAGASGAGAAMKLVINLLLGAHLQTLAEAMALGQKAGIEKNRLLDILGETAHVTPAQKAKMANARSGEYPAQFPIRLLHKDFGLILRLAQELSVPLPATAAAAQMCAAETARGNEEDCSAVFRLMASLAGIE
jgi:3-hydroxyisobutyrate dehydrogenase